MDSLMTIDEVAKRTRLTVNTLRWMRQQGNGPKSGKLGRRVMYRERDVDAWIAAAFDGSTGVAS